MYSRYLYVYQCVHYFAWSYIAVLMLYRKYYINKFDLKDLIWNSIAKLLLPEASFGHRVLSSPASVGLCVCINHELVRSITHHPVKLGSPNLDQRCKTPWFGSLLFLGMIDLNLQGQIQLESQILPHFELVNTITLQPFKLESANVNRKCILALSRSLLILDLIGFDLHFHFQSWNLFFLPNLFALFLYIFSETRRL